MDLLIKVDDSQAYECTMCKTTPCCAYDFHIEFGDMRRIWEKREELDLKEVGDFVKLKKPGIYYLKKKGDEPMPDCVFYDAGCVLHREFGKEYKPVVCKAYPYEIDMIKIDEDKAEVKVWRKPNNPCPADCYPVETQKEEIVEICKLYVKQYIEHIELVEGYKFDIDNETLKKILETPENEIEINIEFALCPWLKVKD